MPTTRTRKRPARKAPRPSLIEAAPVDDDSFYETVMTAVLRLLEAQTTGSIFAQRDGGKQWRVTVEEVKEGRA